MTNFSDVHINESSLNDHAVISPTGLVDLHVDLTRKQTNLKKKKAILSSLPLSAVSQVNHKCLPAKKPLWPLEN